MKILVNTLNLIITFSFLQGCSSSSTSNTNSDISSPWFNFSNDTPYSFSPSGFKIRKPYSQERYKYRYKNYEEVSDFDKTYSN